MPQPASAINPMMQLSSILAEVQFTDEKQKQ